MDRDLKEMLKKLACVYGIIGVCSHVTSAVVTMVYQYLVISLILWLTFPITAGFTWYIAEKLG